MGSEELMTSKVSSVGVVQVNGPLSSTRVERVASFVS
jgi:hypothetical protein